jgi:flagellar biosynthesis/type III secretory pathway chaperone
MNMEVQTPEVSWEGKFAALLGELSAVQSEMLQTLAEKRQVLMRTDGDTLSSITAREERLVARLQDCLDRRLSLLAEAGRAGLQAPNLRTLARSLPAAQHRQIAPQLEEASRRARLLQQESLTNWVIAQRTLIHLSQLLEIIATGGRLQPTYGRETTASAGALLNQVG